MSIPEDADVIGMICLRDAEGDILVVTENGYGKRSAQEDYRQTSRGGKGIKAMNITEKTGKLIAVKAVTDRDHVMIINESGLTIRLAISELRLLGRTTQGVRLINVQGKDHIASVARVKNGADDDEEAAALAALAEAEAAEAIEAADLARIKAEGGAVIEPNDEDLDDDAVEDETEFEDEENDNDSED
jgi:DNA gyrase subunit A